MRKIFLFTFMLLSMKNALAQQDTIIVLEEVVLSDSRLKQFSNGIKVHVLKDSVLHKAAGSLTNTLRYNSNIYFKENGFGMVSSASFRGTSASQTAVIWNGININSQLNGQTDFNTILPQNFDQISVRSGGGSTQYGTGAIGGSIHLDNVLKFNSKLTNKLALGYGSFNTRNVYYKSVFGSEKTALSIGLGHNASDNDYKYLGYNRKNENGAFLNNSVDLGLGVLVSKTSLIKLYQSTFLGDRDFSGTLTAPSNSNYKDLNSRSLLEWVNFKNNKTQRVKVAYLYERYKYHQNKAGDFVSYGKAENFILNYDYKYQFKKILLNGIVDYNNIVGEGTSIKKAAKEIVATTFLMSHRLSDKTEYGVNLRKDWVSDYDSPFVFAVHGKYKIAPNYEITLNGSKNFRAPTYNDLYWKGGATGNSELVPETAYQAEVGQNIIGKAYIFNVTGYYISTKDLIQWRPNTLGVWSPINVASVHQYGLETSLNLTKRINKHSFSWQHTYAFTRSVNKETNYQLLYVPKHRYTSTLVYHYNNWRFSFQSLFNGEVYTTTDNSQSLANYFIGNSRLVYQFLKIKEKHINVGLNVNNLFNKKYENVAFRPMPNRNIQLLINFKF